MEILNVANTRTKKILIQMINQVIDDNQWSNKNAAYMLQTALSDISRIRRLKITNFSLERLLIFLAMLGYKVTIIIDTKKSKNLFEILKKQDRLCLE